MKIAIFYHIGQFNNWRSVYNEQVRKLFLSGLYDAASFIHCGINGDQPLPNQPDKFISKRNDDHVLEADTLKSLWSFAKVNPGYKILYLHTKGVTWTNEFHSVTTSWRRYMEKYLIRQWKDCAEQLNYYDACGVLYRNKAAYGLNTPQYIEIDANYFDGNFWWATSDYISRLDPNYLYTNDNVPWLRGKSELWIGSGNPNAYVMHDIDYANPYSCDFGDANEYC